MPEKVFQMVAVWICNKTPHKCRYAILGMRSHKNNKQMKNEYDGSRKQSVTVGRKHEFLETLCSTQIIMIIKERINWNACGMNAAWSLGAQNNGERPTCACRNKQIYIYFFHLYFSSRINILTKCITHLAAVFSDPPQCGSCCGLRGRTYLSYCSVERQFFFNMNKLQRPRNHHEN